MCWTCLPRDDQQCSICGQHRRCEVARATGLPWCERCQKSYCRCSSCATVAPLRGGTTAAPLCARCVNPDPGFWGRCPICRDTWQFGSRPCQRCAVDQALCSLLGSDPDNLPAQFVPFRDALVAVDRPDHARGWLAKPRVRQLLTTIGTEQRPVTHELLDELDGGKTLDYLRAVLVGSGVLPDRDETLARLERWVDAVLAGRDNLDQRRVLHGYAVWHHLRRLRARLDGRPATVLQEWNVRTGITAAVELLDFLDERSTTLLDCTQSSLDDFLANTATYPAASAGFVRWAVKHKHATRLTAPAHAWLEPTDPLDEQHRWTVARRLLADNELPLDSRVAELLLVLYAQHVSTIARLQLDDVDCTGEQVSIRFGTVPIRLPPPLDSLMVELIGKRRGNTLLDAPGTWLFPGRHPGKPISDSGLALKLRAIGIQPRRHRNTALFALASELPAALLARMLGVHISVAGQWQRVSGGDWTAYVADVATRSGRADQARPQLPGPPTNSAITSSPGR